MPVNNAENGLPRTLVLASQSPVRKELLANAGIAFTARPAHVDEKGLSAEFFADGGNPEALALHLARAKAGKIADGLAEDLIIGADQVLLDAGEVLHKPPTMAAARARLECLSGRTHSLVTAVTLRLGPLELWHHSATATLTLHQVSGDEIDRILALEGEKSLGSVGAYRIEGPAIRLFETIKGDHFAILGLPLVPLLNALREHVPFVFGPTSNGKNTP